MAGTLTACSSLLAQDPTNLPTLDVTLRPDGSVAFYINNDKMDVLGNNSGATGWVITSFHLIMTPPGFTIELPAAYLGPATFGDPILNPTNTGFTLNFSNPIDTELGANFGFAYTSKDPRIAITDYKFDTSDGKLHDFGQILRLKQLPNGNAVPLPDSANSLNLLGPTALGLFALHRWNKRPRPRHAPA